MFLEHYTVGDIGGPNARVATLPSLLRPGVGQPALYSERFSLEGLSYDEGISRLINYYLIARHNDKQPSTASALSIAGVLDQDHTTVLKFPNLHDWQNQPIRSDLESALDQPVLIHNDAVAIALGEAMYGRLTDGRYWIFVWGTGFGGSYVIKEGPLIRLEPREPGHRTIVPDGALCGCGRRGCLEAYVGGAHMRPRYGGLARDLDPDKRREMIGHLADGLIPALKDRPADRLIFGGGIASNESWLLSELRTVLDARLGYRIDVSRVLHREFAGVYGALALIARSKRVHSHVRIGPLASIPA